MVQFCGDPAHPFGVGPAAAVQQADASGVAGERPVGERVDDPDAHERTVGRRG